MDPLSIVGVIGSVVSIVDVVSKSIRKLSELKSRYRNAPFQISTLIGQLYIIQAALGELETWKSKDLARDPRFRQLALQIDTSLESFCPLILALEQALDGFDPKLPADEGPMKILSFVWNERELNQYLNLIDRQVNALNLFLQAIQCRTWTEQQQMVVAEDSLTVLRLARDCNLSIRGLHDGTSIYSETTDAISLAFEFDALILGSRAYQIAHRSHLKQAIRAGRQQEQYMQSDHEDNASLLQPSIKSKPEAKSEGLKIRPRRQSLPLIPDPKSEPRPFVARLFKTKKAVQRDAAKARLAAIDDFLKRDRRPTFNLLILGLPQSGKSTLNKRMKIRFDGYEMNERAAAKLTLFSNLLLSTRNLLEDIEFSNLAPSIKLHAETVSKQDLYVEEIDAEVVSAIENLWADDTVLHAYEQYCENLVDENVKELVKDISRLIQADYVPSDEDLLKTYERTIGRNETSWDFDNIHSELRLIDTGGSRPDRRTWIYCSDKPGAIVFCFDVVAYPKKHWSYRDNCMEEQLLVFDSVVNSRVFMPLRFILMFTKIDRLSEVIERTPFPRDDFPASITIEDESTATLCRRWLEYLEWKCLSMISDEEKRKEIKIMHADLAHISQADPVGEMLETIIDWQVEDSTTDRTDG